MDHRNTAVLGGGCSDKRVGQWHAVVSVASVGELADSAHRGVCEARSGAERSGLRS